MPLPISYAQNGEDVRIWHAFGPRPTCEATDARGNGLTYVDVGANQPRDLSLTAALYDLGWSGLLIEPDPELARELQLSRPRDTVFQAAAADLDSELTFYRVPGTGLGTLDSSEAQAAADRGFEVYETTVPARPLDDFLAAAGVSAVHVLSIDVEGAEERVIRGLAFREFRPWVLCIEAVQPGTNVATHTQWETMLFKEHYRFVAFDGINRWYVADEHADEPVAEQAGAPTGTTIAEAIATPFHVLDEGLYGWKGYRRASLEQREQLNTSRVAWQRELLLQDMNQQVPAAEYERQIHELRGALIQVEGSRSLALARYVAKAGRAFQHLAHRIRRSLPSFIDERIIRERHLRQVEAAMPLLTEHAYLGLETAYEVTWAVPDQQRPPVPPGLTLGNFTDADAIETWLREHPFDSDAQLESRMDNHDDEVGRVRAALRSRLRIQDAPSKPHWAGGKHVVFDARCLQSAAFASRGIGRFAQAALRATREAVTDDRVTLIVDRALPDLPSELAGTCEQVTSVSEKAVARFSVFIQPSPMTHTPNPVIPLLHSDAYCLAIVFDFIPMHYPSLYLRHAAPRAEYAANLDALRTYTDYVCISGSVRRELGAILGRPASGPEALRSVVAWPRDVLTRGDLDLADSSISNVGPIVLMTGDEPRKNTFGGLAGIAAATSAETARNVVVVGMAGQEDRVHHWSIAAAMRPGEARTAPRIDDAALRELLTTASCVVVPTFDEGLSLPVIEAIRAGVPVALSGIKPHRELVGRGRFTFNPKRPRSIARAVRHVRGRNRIHRSQRKALRRHAHASLEAVIERNVLAHVRPAEVSGSAKQAPSGRLKVGIATPWRPQRSGVADYSTTVFTELAKHVDVTIYTTSDAAVSLQGNQHTPIQQRSIDEVFADPARVHDEHDAFICVVGNSHYHLPFVQVLQDVDAIVIAHDTRMVEFYLALRGPAGLERLMLTTADPSEPQVLEPALSDQIDDMRLLQNAGLWEIAQRSTRFMTHSLSAAPRISQETGHAVYVLPFANYRLPVNQTVTAEDRAEARRRLGLDDFPEGTIHLASFGYVDQRTKMTDVVIEAAGWLTQWGYPIALHFVGSANPVETATVTDQARRAGLSECAITGFQTEEQYRDWLLAVDVGIQLRISPLLGVSGPLSDLAAYGTPAVASQGLCIDVDTPDYIHRLPDAVSPITVAHAIEDVLRDSRSSKEREARRLEYLAAKTPAEYARLLLDQIRETLQ